MLVRVAFVFWVGVFAVEHALATQALAIRAGGEISISTSGQNCGEIVSGRQLVTLVQKKEGEGTFAPLAYKLTLQLGDGDTATLSSFRTDGEDVLPASGGEEVIGEVRSVDSSILAVTVRYDTDGKGKGDEVWFTSVLDDYPSKVVVSGSSVGRERNCVVSWFGTLTALF